jgi:hypothetical protein
MTSIFVKRHILILGLVLALSGCATTNQDWQQACKGDTTEAYKTFIAEHPKSKQAAEAQNRILQIEKVNEKIKIIQQQILKVWPSLHKGMTIDEFETVIGKEAVDITQMHEVMTFMKSFTGSSSQAISFEVYFPPYKFTFENGLLKTFVNTAAN